MRRTVHPHVCGEHLFAKQDAYGLGPGLYPKAKAPKPPFHPFCRCGWISKRLISADGAKFRPEAHRVYLNQVRAKGGNAAAAKVVGSRAKLAVALTQPLDEVYNIHRPPPYRLGRMGDAGANHVYHASSMGEPNDRPQPTTLANRSTWQGNEIVGIVAGESAVKQHQHYAEAKTGGTVAAARLVMNIVDDGWLARNGKAIQAHAPVIVGVHAVEGMSTNAIGPMLSQWIGLRLGLPVDDNIVQINRVGHTGSSGWSRLARQALFTGAVMPGRAYWLADDFIGQGGTMANLRGYIESNGGRVVGYTALTGRTDSGVLGLKPETLLALRRKHGQLESWWQQQFGFGFDHLTESEARYLIRAEDADTIRNRMATG